jgi:tight adherence protein C
MAALIILFVALFGLLASGGLLLFYRDAVASRFAVIVGRREGPLESLAARLLRARPAAVEQIVKPFENILPRNPDEVSFIQRRFMTAGYRNASAVNIFYGAKILVPLTLCVLATITRLYSIGPFFIYTVCGGVGFIAPNLWLGNRVRARQRKLRRGLPEALDLMVICTEAGLGIDQTVLRVSKELKLNQPELAEEFNLVNLEQKAGRPRDEALKHLADRADIDSVRALSNTLVQADTFGTSIAKTLRVYSDTLRTQRRQMAEEKAAKTTVKLVFPLVLFIFPAIFVVALGPAIITMLEGFKNYLSN